MPKPSAQVLLMQAQREIQQLKFDNWVGKGFTVQQCLDMAMIALHQEFQFGPERCEKFEKAFRRVFVDFAELCLDDGKDDGEIVYTKEILDRAVREARGEILPFDERYAQERLYFRESREDWKKGGTEYEN